MIILVGMPKSGTSSFDELFKQLGYTTYHWKKGTDYIGTIIENNKRKGLPLLHGFKKDDCITQMDVCISKEHAYWPQLVDYERLYNENPDALFILNTRNPLKLLSSFKRWNSYDKRLYTYNPELVSVKTDEGFVDFVNKHYRAIKSFFASKPGAKFLVFDIETDSIEKLRPYIDIKDIRKMPHENKNIA